jgi:Holliday junction resolvasome RuvABC endonuclease subunit
MEGDMILAISPKTSKIGFVVLRKGEMIHWGTKCFKGPWNRRKLKWILHTVERLITDYGITQIAIKYPDQDHHRKGFTQLIGALNVFFDSKYISVTYYTLKEIKEIIGNGELISRKELVEFVWKQYPGLLMQRHIRKVLHHPYHIKLLEAAATAYVHLERPKEIIHK